MHFYFDCSDETDQVIDDAPYLHEKENIDGHIQI